MLYRTHCALSLLVQDMPHTAWRSTTQRLAELISKEPGVADRILKEANRRAKQR